MSQLGAEGDLKRESSNEWASRNAGGGESAVRAASFIANRMHVLPCSGAHSSIHSAELF